RHDRLLVDERVALQEIGVRGVVVDHHLVDLLEAILVALGEALVIHSEAPMRIARRKTAVGGDLVHLLVGQDLERRRKEIETVCAGVALDNGLDVAEVRRQRHLQRSSLRGLCGARLRAAPSKVRLNRWRRAPPAPLVAHYFPFPRKSRIESMMASLPLIS